MESVSQKQRIVITGASGQLGQELKVLLDQDVSKECFFLDRKQLPLDQIMIIQGILSMYQTGIKDKDYTGDYINSLESSGMGNNASTFWGLFKTKHFLKRMNYLASLNKLIDSSMVKNVSHFCHTIQEFFL